MATLTSMPAAAATIRFDGAARVRAALLVAAFIAAFWDLLDFVPPRLGTLVNAWTEADWSHGPAR